VCSSDLGEEEDDVVLAVDIYDEALRMHKLNHPDVETLNYELGGSITLAASMIRKRLKKGVHFHLHGSPPCQAISTASNGSGQTIADGMHPVEWFLKLVRYMKPDSWSMENVVPLGKKLKEMGVPYVIVNAADYGVPQARKRVFAGEGWTLTPTHSDNHVSVLDALPHLLDELPPDHRIVSRRRGKNHPSSVKHQAYSGDDPSHTITRLGHVIETPVERIRSLTVQESATLQGYPDLTIPDKMKKKDQWVIVGNMVCPPIAKAIIQGLIE
jgi:site-specific DNA-cytosine methylase